MAVWTVKGGQRGEREDRLLDNNLIGGGWEALPSLMDIHSKDALSAIYAESYPDQGASTRANYVGQLMSLTERMQIGELVVMPLKSTGTIAVGKVTGPYAYRTDLGDDLKHVRSVKWIKTDVARDAFDQDLLYSFGAFLTFGQVHRERTEERILAAMKVPVGPTTVLESKSDPQVVAADDGEPPNVVGLAREQIRQAITQNFAGHRLTALVAEILRAQGFTQAEESPPGADMGVDILAGMGPLGMDLPRLAVQVKTGQAGVDEFRQLQGSMGAFKAEQGLLVAWSGFKGTVRKEARTSHFSVRLWDADDLLDQVFVSYDKFSAKTRAELPLSRIWSLSITKEG